MERSCKPSFSHLPAIALVSAGHFGRAAESCYVSQSTLSAGIRELETLLGVTLVERETLDSALMSARSVLEAMGWERHTARQQQPPIAASELLRFSQRGDRLFPLTFA